MFTGDEVAVITGASKGIGKAVARELAQHGVSTVLTYVRSSSQMDETLSEIKDAGGNAIAIRVDVSDEKEIKMLFKEVKKTIWET